jgi:hypothetical protein
MSFSQDAQPPEAACADRASPPEEVTETDMVISPPEYLQAIHDALGRAERAYAAGDPAQAALLADEGLATVRLTEDRLGPLSVPAHYRAFFHALRIQPVFRAALALLKRGLLARQRPDGAREEAFGRAWQLFGPAVADLDEDLPVEMLACDFPVAGRVLRGVARLREHLLGRLHKPAGFAGPLPAPPGCKVFPFREFQI